MDTIQILFRCEFGVHYGFGHVMRSIALVQAFQKYENVEMLCLSTSNVNKYKELFKHINVSKLY